MLAVVGGLGSAPGPGRAAQQAGELGAVGRAAGLNPAAETAGPHLDRKLLRLLNLNLTFSPGLWLNAGGDWTASSAKTLPLQCCLCTSSRHLLVYRGSGSRLLLQLLEGFWTLGG